MPRAGRPSKKPTVVCLVRHGTTGTTGKILPGRAKGLHLSEAGQKEAEGVAGRLAGAAVTAVYASPLERARETAAPIGKAFDRRVVVDRGLLECDFGEWTGQELAKLSKLAQWKAVQRYPSGFRFPGGESFQELQTRLQETVTRLVAAHPGETIVAVSHADCIKAVVAVALGVPLDLFQRIVIGPCSATVIAYASEGPTVLAVNSLAVPPLPRAKEEANR
jgi:probable phosphomutase (TIGR03848 family)